MATITVLQQTTLDFTSVENDLLVCLKNLNWEYGINTNTEYFVTWNTGLEEQVYSSIAIQGQSVMYFGNTSLINFGINTGEPFLFVINNSTNTVKIYNSNITNSSCIVSIVQNINDNIIIRNPLGNAVTYGEYDTVILDTAGGHKAYYHRLPVLSQTDNGKILIAKDTYWITQNFPQADWNQGNIQANDYIKNKPTNLATQNWVTEQVQKLPSQQQADWKQDDTTSPAFILNKPTIPDPQIQSDWNQTNTNAKDYIKNVPKAFQHDEKLIETTQSVLLDTPEGWIKKEVPQLLMTVTFEDETVKNYHIVGTEVIV